MLRQLFEPKKRFIHSKNGEVAVVAKSYKKKLAYFGLFGTFALILLASSLINIIGRAGAFAGGSGDASDPYLISTCIELQDISGSGGIYLDKHFELTQNIDCSDTANWNYVVGDPSYYQGFTPIGDQSWSSFNGTFDGKGYAINDLLIDSGNNYVGLFGYVDGAHIRNLDMIRANVNSTGGMVGVVAGRANSSTFTNIHTDGNVNQRLWGDSFHIEQLNKGEFNEVYKQGYPVKYATNNFEFNNTDESLTLKINQKGRKEFAGVDAAILSACGTDLVPTSAVYSGTNQSVLGDILKIDNNVIIAHEKPFEVTWNMPKGCNKATLRLNANEYGSGAPMQFPQNSTVIYSLGSNQKAVSVNGNISETDGANPSYTAYLKPSTGHPWGNAYLYFSDDKTNLYISADITADNTNDYGKDWFAVNVGGKRFVVSDSDSTYGVCGFGMTSKVSYKHTSCELKIPKNQLNNTSNAIMNFEYYGTAAIYATGGIAGRIYDSDVTSSSANVDTSGLDGVGGLVGEANGASVINKSLARGNVHGNQSTGGLVGINGGTSQITKSYATGIIFGINNSGGLVGYNDTDATITDTYARGDINGNYYGSDSYNTGGLVGENYGKINNSYSIGDVTINNYFAGDDYVGGLIGLDHASGANGTSNSFSVGNVSTDNGANFVGGFIGAGSAFNYKTGNNYWYDNLATGIGDGRAGSSQPTMTVNNDYFKGTDANTRLPSANWDFTNIWAAHANDYPDFIPSNSYSLTYNTGVNGSITGNLHQVVDQGKNGTNVMAVPAVGYHFVEWSDNHSIVATRTDLNVQEDINATATFALNSYTLSYSAWPNGTITGSTPQTVNHGSDGTEVTAVPNSGYYFTNWSDGVLSASRTDLNVQNNISVTATFASGNVYYWSGAGTTNNWSEPSNWLVNGFIPSDYPDSNDSAIFDSTGSKDLTVDVPVDVTLLSFYQTYTGAITVNQNINVSANLLLEQGVVLPLGDDGVNGHSLTVGGYGQIQGSIVSNLDGALNFHNLNVIDGTIDGLDSNLTITGDLNFIAPTNTGYIDIVGSGAIDVTGNAHFDNGWVETNNGSQHYRGDVGVVNNCDVYPYGIGSLVVDGNLTLKNNGWFEVDGSGNIDIYGSTSINGGTIYTYGGYLTFHSSVDSMDDGVSDTEISSRAGDITFETNVINHDSSDIHSEGGTIHVVGDLTNNNNATITNTAGKINIDGVANNNNNATITNTAGQRTISTSGQNYPNEPATNAFDKNVNTKWLNFSNNSWISYQYPNSTSFTTHQYKITSGNDNLSYPGRHPISWTFEGSNDGSSWDVLDTQSGIVDPGNLVTVAYDISNSTAYQYYRLNNLVVSGTTIQLSEIELVGDIQSPPTGITVGGNLNITDGATVNTSGVGNIDVQGNLLIDSGGGINAQDYNLTVVGNTTVINWSYLVNAANVDFGGNLQADGTVISSSGNISVASNTNITANGTLSSTGTNKDIALHETVNDGSLMANSGNLDVVGNLTSSGYVNAAGSVDVSESLISSADVHATSLNVAKDVTLSGGPSWNFGGEIYTNGPIIIGGNYLGNGGFINSNVGSLTISGNATLNGDVGNNHDSEIFSGDIFIGGDYEGTHSYISIGSYNILINGNALVKGSIYAGDLHVAGNLTSNNYTDNWAGTTGSLNHLTNITVDGLIYNDLGSYIIADNNMTFNRDVSNTNGSYIMPVNLIVAGNFNNESGSYLNGSSGDWDMNGNFINNNSSVSATSGNWYLANDFTNNVPNPDNSATPYFAPSFGTVIFDVVNSSIINGSTNFYNFSSVPGETLTFAAASTQTINGDFNLNGTAGNLITLRSSVSPAQAKINPTGTIHVSFVDVQDNNNINGAAINPTSSVDSGNTINWWDPFTHGPDTPSADWQYGANIYGDLAVWYQIDGLGTEKVFKYDFINSQLSQLNNYPGTQYEPDIYQHKVVYLMDNGPLTDKLYLYDMDTNTETPLNNATTDNWQARIFGDYVVWQGDAVFNGSSQIFMYKISTGITTQLTNLIGDSAEPEIYGNKIVWSYWEAGNNSIINIYDIDTGQVSQISNGNYDSYNPAIYENKVVWEDDTRSQVYLYDIDTTEEYQVTDSFGGGSYNGAYMPDIYKNYVTWFDNPYPNPDSVYVTIVDDSSGTKTSHTSKVETNEEMWQPVIYGNHVLYTAITNLPSDSKIRFGTFSTVKSSTGVNGTISPLEENFITLGRTKIFTINPSSGASISNVTADGISIGAPSSYIYSTNTVGFHTIDAQFSINNPTPTPSATPAPTVVPTTGPTPTTNPTIIPVVTPTTIPLPSIQYVISFEDNQNVGIDPITNPVRVDSNSSYKFVLKPYNGYKISDIIANGSSIKDKYCSKEGQSYKCELEKVDKDYSIKTEIIRQSQVAGASNPKHDDNHKNLITRVLSAFIDAISILGSGFITIVKKTPQPVAYSFPWLLFVLLGILTYRLIRQTSKEIENSKKFAKLIDLDKNIATQKESFLMLSSHYVRTPMTIIKGGVELVTSMGKLPEQASSLLQKAVDDLDARVGSIFKAIDSNTYLNRIIKPDVEVEKKRLLKSAYLWIPPILVGVVFVYSNYLFITVSKININIINLLTELVAFAIIAQFFIRYYRKRKTQQAIRLKYQTELEEQTIVDKARNDFMAMSGVSIAEELNKIDEAENLVEDKEALKMANKGVDGLKDLAAKFGLLSALQAGAVATNTEYNSLLDEVKALMDKQQDKITQKELTIKLPDSSIVIHTDQLKLSYVLDSVIDNAVKFNKPGGRIDVSFKEHKDSVAIIVEDTGIGVSQDAKDSLFTPFSRGTSTLTYDYEGMGTNLYIAKITANYLGGDITLESSQDTGTKVVVTIAKVLR